MFFQSKGASAILCAGLLVHECVGSVTQTPQAPSAPQAPGAAENTATKIPADQLDSLVAPIALYPDPMLAQILAASTYPLELIQLQQWLQKNTNLKDKALADAVSKQPWDPSVQAMAALPDVVKRLSDDIQWTTDLGNAFLAQQSDVMDAVQRMRKKAKDSGNLKSNEQQKVETKVVESKSVVVIEQANPQVVYVPSYNPTVVYGPPVYPYPPITYPPPGYYAAGMAISFGVGVAMGAAMGGGWGWGCGWGGNNDITINTNNNFNRNTNINGGNRNQVNAVGNRSGTSNTKWQHNSQHRGGAPYSDRATANRYGGTARGDSMNNRQANARQNQNLGGRQQSAGGGTARGQSQLQSSAVDRNRGSAASMDTNRSPSGGDRIGNRETSGGRSSDAFGGASGGTSGASARRSSSRGASSMRGSRGGGRRR